jgi:hypothetical protein
MIKLVLLTIMAMAVAAVVVCWYKTFRSPEATKRKIYELEIQYEKLCQERNKACSERGGDVRCYNLTVDCDRLSTQLAALRARLES